MQVSLKFLSPLSLALYSSTACLSYPGDPNSSIRVAAIPRNAPAIAPIGPSKADPVAIAAMKVPKPTTPAAILNEAAAMPWDYYL